MMKFGLILCSIFLSQESLLESTHDSDKGLRHHVVSDLGSSSGVKEFPFQAVIQRKNGPFRCGATILNEHFVLTAARCNGPDPSRLAVRVGITIILPDEGTSYDIKKVHVHPKFQQPKKYDAALFEVDGEIEFSASVQPINLLGKKNIIFDDMKAELVGWSDKVNIRAEEDPNTPIVFLTKTSESLVTYGNCAKFYPKMHVVDDLICNDVDFGRSSCMRHPGSSLVAGDKLYGVLLNDFSCEYPRLPKLFLNVAVVRDWILEVTGIPDADDDATT